MNAFLVIAIVLDIGSGLGMLEKYKMPWADVESCQEYLKKPEQIEYHSSLPVMNVSFACEPRALDHDQNRPVPQPSSFKRDRNT